MTNFDNAERLREVYLQTVSMELNVKNICRALPNWNGCDYCDIYMQVMELSVGSREVSMTAVTVNESK